MTDIIRIDQNTRRSRASVFGDIVFLAGQVADDKGADITTQTREVLDCVESSLIKAGSDKTRLLHVTLYLPVMTDYEAMNAVWDAWVPEGTAPSRACIQAGLAHPGWRLEAVVTAARG